MIMRPSLLAVLVLANSPFPDANAAGPALGLNDKGYFETRGLTG